MGKFLSHGLSHLRRFVCLAVVCIFFSQSAVMAAPAESPPENAGSTGWVEISAAVPADFTAPLVVSLMNTETEEEYDFPVIFENNYITLEELPVGTYSFSMGFVEGGDFRYSLVPVESEYIVEYDEVAAAVKIDVIFNEEYANGVSLSDTSEDPDETSEDIPSVPDDKEKNPEPAPVEEKTTLGTILKRIGIALAGALVFSGLAFLAVFLVRKYNE